MHRPTNHHLTRASIVYVSAWLVGLALKPAIVSSSDAADVIVRSYLDDRSTSIAQVLVVHGVAGIAALAFSVGLAGFAESSQQPAVARWGRVAGFVVCLVSLAQAAIGVSMISTAGMAAPSTVRQLLIGVERLDSVKLVALAVVCVVGMVLARCGLLARWTGRLAAGATACLLLAALALSNIASVLSAASVPALILLLVWVGAVPHAIRRTGA